MIKRKCFDTESAAKKFAARVNGTYKMKDLPGYMSVETVYVVRYEVPDEDDEYTPSATRGRLFTE